jgi:hypothetical protein
LHHKSMRIVHQEVATTRDGGSLKVTKAVLEEKE